MARSRIRVGVAILGLLAAVALIAVATQVDRGRSTGGKVASPEESQAPLKPPDELIGIGLTDDPSEPPYPDTWKVGSVSEAASTSDFRLFVPEAPVANSENLMGVYVYPGGAVALVYPSPGRPEAYIRQEYIEVWEALWAEKDDPRTFFKRHVAEDPIDGRSFTTIAGLPAVVVSAHSKDATGQANAAFVELVVDGTDIEISGGEDLNALIAVAESIIAQASTTPTATPITTASPGVAGSATE